MTIIVEMKNMRYYSEYPEGDSLSNFDEAKLVTSVWQIIEYDDSEGYKKVQQIIEVEGEKSKAVGLARRNGMSISRQDMADKNVKVSKDHVKYRFR